MRIRMELLSDALAGSGEAFAGTVDKDIAFDERGLPFIPAKRIRGVLRESMKELEFLGLAEPGTSEALFGVPGASASSPFIIHDGRVENAETLAAFLDSAKLTNKLADIFAPRFVLECFSYLRAQTSVEDGVAKENTLRISRVLKKGQVFHFEAECPSHYRTVLEAACASTRAFGASRNRGLGEIRLFCEDALERKGKTAQVTFPARDAENVVHEMPVSIRSLSLLIASDRIGENGDSGGFIPGSFLLGALAARYLTVNGKDSASNPSFVRLFLSGETIWCNLYPVPNEDSSEGYAPSPVSIRKYKNRDTFFDLSCVDNSEKEPHKGLGEVFLVQRGNKTYYAHSPRMTIQYHHRRAEDPAYGRALGPEADIPGDRDKGTFFQFQSLERDQFFKGSIIGSLEDLKTVSSLLPEDGILRLGKSRTAQYGRCRVSLSSPRPLGREEDEVWEDGETLLFRLLSDTILLNENGHPEPNPRLLAKEVAHILDVPEGVSVDETRIFVRKRLVGGYLGVWNLPRVQYPAIAAGSVIAMMNDSGKSLDMARLRRTGVGLRVVDGFGRLDWKSSDDMERMVEIPRNKQPEGFVDQVPEEAKNLAYGLLRRYFLKELKKGSREAVSSAPVLPGSFIGRLGAIVRSTSSFKDLSSMLASFKGKPAGNSIKKIADKLFIDGETLAFNEELFRKKAAQWDPVARIQTLRELRFQNTEATYDDYREYVIAFLSALKLKGRRSVS